MDLGAYLELPFFISTEPIIEPGPPTFGGGLLQGGASHLSLSSLKTPSWAPQKCVYLSNRTPMSLQSPNPQPQTHHSYSTKN